MRLLFPLVLLLLSAGTQAQLRIQVVGLQAEHRLNDVAVSICSGGKWTTIAAKVEGNVLLVSSPDVDSVQLSFVGYQNVAAAVRGRQDLGLQMQPEPKHLKQVRVCGRQGRYDLQLPFEIPFRPGTDGFVLGSTFDLPDKPCRMAGMELKLRSVQSEDTLELFIWEHYTSLRDRRLVYHQKHVGLKQRRAGYLAIPFDTLWLDEPTRLVFGIRIGSTRVTGPTAPCFFFEMMKGGKQLRRNGEMDTTLPDTDPRLPVIERMSQGAKVACRFDYWD